MSLTYGLAKACIIASVIAACNLSTASAAGDSLVWNSQTKRVDAQIESADLPSVLRRLSAATGWQVYIEPHIDQSISVRFKSLPVGEALGRLLGDLSFALLPRTNAPSRLLIYRTSLQEATELLGEELELGTGRRKGPIPNEVVVTLRLGSKDSIDSLAKRLGAKVIGEVEGLNTYRLRFADESSAQAAREALDREPGVASTDLNYPIDSPTRVDGLQASSAGAFTLKPKLGKSGDQVIVGLIDTPVQTLDSKMSSFVLPSVHVAGEPTAASDELTHGTSMAETILRGLALAPQESGGSSVRILPVDVYGPNADTTSFDVAKGIYAAMANGATVINMSLGGDGNSQFLQNLIEVAHQQGVLFFGAAGNHPTADLTFPAAYPDVVAVTAADRKGNIAPYASRGSFIDAIAPGTSLVEYGGQSYLVSGTSTATAYVSGTAAGYRAGGNSPQKVEAFIRDTLAPKPASGQ